MSVQKNENRQDLNLVERIGIDRSVLCNFNVLEVDEKKFKNAAQNQFGEKVYSQIMYDDQSPIKLDDGRGVSKLVIKHSRIGKFMVSFEKNNLSGREYIKSSLELMVSEDANNVQNLNSVEYQARISNVFKELDEKFGLKIDYSSIRIKKLEINATFFLNEAYEKYRLPILLLIRNVPVKRYGKNKENNAVKYAAWYEANAKLGEEKLETALVKNSSIELKIYNKGKHLNDLGMIDALDKGLMRVEYTIKDRRILQNAFGDDLVTSLTDQKINSLFRKYFNRDIVVPYQNWVCRNHEHLVNLTKKHRKLYQRWTSTFFRECRQYEELHGLPALFDIEDMKSVFRELEKKSARNSARKFAKFKDRAIFEADLFGNTARVKEIISKIEGMYL
jgi:hypothetical protein